MAYRLFEIKKIDKSIHGSLLLQHYIYKFKRENIKEQSKNWLCKDCKATITTNQLSVIKIKGEKIENLEEDEFMRVLKNSHTHEPANKFKIQIDEAIQK
jgi:hypothetical protein